MPRTQNPQGAIAHRLLRRKQVEQAIGLSRSTIYARLDKNSPRYDPTFPKPITLGSMSVAWVESEIQGWISSRIADSRKTAKA
jgi:prophage regulatory protein